MFRKKYYCIKQHDISDCGAACLATISRQYGLHISIATIRDAAGTDSEGTNIYGMIKAAEKLGFSAKGVKGDKTALEQKFPLPAIAHITVENRFLHYVVIHEISNKEIIIADPRKGIIKYKSEDFLEVWTGILILISPTMTFEKGNKTKSIFVRYQNILKSQKRLIANICLASIVYSFLGIVGAFYFKVLMDDVLRYNLEKTLHILSLGIILLNIFKILLNFFRNNLILHLSQKIDIPLILGYYCHVIDLPMKFFDTRKVGEIISRFMDSYKIREAISGAALIITIDTVLAVAGGIILYIQNKFLFAIASVILLFYMLVVLVFNKPIKTVNEETMEANAKLTTYLIESLSGIETIKAFNMQGEAKFRTEIKFVKLLKTMFKSGMLHNIQSMLTEFIAIIGELIILWAGAYKVIKGEMSIGELLVFNSLLGYFVEPVKNLINLQPMLQTAIVASERLGEILDLELETYYQEEKKIKKIEFKGTIKFKNVDFQYGTRGLALKNINLVINQGEKVAFVGESGSGKSTLVKLLMNFYKIEKGEILIDDYNIKDLELEKLRERISYVAQETFIFNGTIEENLSLGSNSISLEQIIDICKQLTIHDYVNNLPLRYGAMLEENGKNLSGGQKQRIAIARALLKHPDILIMDEATSNLDSITEKIIEDMIQNLNIEITTIIIAHRLSTIKRCDRIYVFDKGQVIEAGPHEILMENRGKYRELWDNQMEGII